MNANARGCVAYVVGRAIGGRGDACVYDYDQSAYLTIRGSVEGNQVNIYDYDRGCYLSGTFGNLYDYGRSAYISLEVNGNGFSGYDHAEGHHFSGTVNGGVISLYDFGLSRRFGYSM